MPLTPEALFLISDEAPHNALPINFRQILTTHLVYPMTNEPIDTTGLDHIYASGSGQFSPSGLDKLTATLPKSFTIIDLREKVHGFINDDAIALRSITNQDYERIPAMALITREQELFTALPPQTTIYHLAMQLNDGGTYTLDPITLTVKTARNEKELTAHHDISYIRLPIIENKPPEDDDTQQIITLIRHMHADRQWMHVHCRLGEGRTTSFLVMYDSLMNAKTVSFDTIINRHYALGGQDLAFVYADGTGRLETLRAFYEWCKHQ